METLPMYAGREGQGTFRTPASVEEMARHCQTNSHIFVRSRHGDARRVKVNGAVRRWKRDTTRIEVPCKYGLYEYFVLHAADINDVLIPYTETPFETAVREILQEEN